MEVQLSSKLPDVKTTIFTVVNKLAKKHSAVNLSQGFPNFEADAELVEAVASAMRQGYNQYAPMAGSMALREQIALMMETTHHTKYNPDTEITITAGATQAIYTAISAFIETNDEVIVFKPAYDCYEPAIEVNGGKTIHVQLQGSQFRIDWNDFKNKITPKTKMVIINTPHNPSGTMLSHKDMEELQNILKGTNIILLSDEVYEHIIFDGNHHESACRFPDLASRSIICSSFGKTFHVTGWKVGYCVGPDYLMQEFRKIHQFNVFSVNSAVQEGLAQYLKKPEHYLQLGAFYQKKRDLFLSELQASKFKIIPSKGTYFQLLDYSEITNESDIDFCKRLIADYKLASIPISVFNINNQDDKVLRFCFAKTDEVLIKATDTLKNI